MTTSNTPIVASSANFDSEILNSDVPVLVDFWAPWCGPCRSQKPIVESLATELSGKAKVAMVNVDEEPQLAQRFNVRSIPALMVVAKGKVVESWAGLTQKDELVRKLENAQNA